MKHTEIDTDGVKNGIDALIAGGRKNTVPWWFYVIDWTLTALYIVVIAGLLVVLVNWIRG